MNAVASRRWPRRRISAGGSCEPERTMSMGGTVAWLVAILVWAGVAVPGAGQQVADFRKVSFSTSDGGVIFANLYGESAHAVLLAHGAVFDKQSWDAVARRLAAGRLPRAGHRLSGLRQVAGGPCPGGAARGRPRRIDYLRAQGAQRVSLIGASMGGGGVGNAAAQAEAGAIDRLILLAAAPAQAPERMQGRKLFIVASGDPARSRGATPVRSGARAQGTAHPARQCARAAHLPNRARSGADHGAVGLARRRALTPGLP